MKMGPALGGSSLGTPGCALLWGGAAWGHQNKAHPGEKQLKDTNTGPSLGKNSLETPK